MKRNSLLHALAWVAGVIGVLLLAAGVVLGVMLYPWLRMPDEPESVIEARWKKVERAAEVPPPSGDDTELLDAIDGFRRFVPPKWSGDEVPLMGRDQLSAARERAIQSFTHWLAAGAPYVAPPCMDTVGSRRSAAGLPSFRLGQAAVFTAQDADDLPQVEAVLAMAQRERRGGQLVDVAVGFALASLTARWSRDRKVPLPARFEPYRPEVKEIRDGLARDVACIHGLMASGTSPLAAAPGRLGGGARPPFGLTRMKRERLVFEQAYGLLFERAEAAGEDWKKMAAEYEHMAHDHPKSLLLAALVVHSNIIRKMGEDKDEYDALVPKP